MWNEANSALNSDESGAPLGHLTIEEQVERATAVHQKYGEQLMRIPHVVGVGVGFVTYRGKRLREVGVVVMVDEKVPLSALAAEEVIPHELDGVRIDVQKSGVLVAG